MATHKAVIVEELFGELSFSTDERRWEVVHTKPRCEKQLAIYCRENNIVYYLPQIIGTRTYQRRKVISSNVMFPGYLFVQIETADRLVLNLSGYVVGYLRVYNQDKLLSDLNNLNVSRNKEAEIRSGEKLLKGYKVEIIQGSLKGMYGIVESHEKISDVHIQVEMLQQAVVVRIDPSQLRVVAEIGGEGKQ